MDWRCGYWDFQYRTCGEPCREANEPCHRGASDSETPNTACSGRNMIFLMELSWKICRDLTKTDWGMIVLGIASSMANTRRLVPEAAGTNGHGDVKAPGWKVRSCVSLFRYLLRLMYELCSGISVNKYSSTPWKFLSTVSLVIEWRVWRGLNVALFSSH